MKMCAVLHILYMLTFNLFLRLEVPGVPVRLALFHLL